LPGRGKPIRFLRGACHGWHQSHERHRQANASSGHAPLHPS
jgi:hypothetical protein